MFSNCGNMSSALLILILEKTQFIGILKSLGATNISIRKVFLIQSSFLISKGIFYGNIIALASFGSGFTWGSCIIEWIS